MDELGDASPIPFRTSRQRHSLKTARHAVDAPSRLEKLHLIHYAYQIAAGTNLVKGLPASVLERAFVWLTRTAKFRLGNDLLVEFKRYQLLCIISALCYVGYKIMKATLSRLSKVKQELRLCMERAGSFEDWVEFAKKLDALEGHRPIVLPRYVEADLKRKAKTLEGLRMADNLEGLAWALRQEVGAERIGKFIAASAGDSTCHYIEPPKSITRFIEEMKLALEYLACHQAIPIVDKIEFFRVCRHALGQTAMTFSGGGSFGHFHFGVSDSLLRAGMLPSVMSGSSAGSIGCAMLCTRTDREIEESVNSWIESTDTDFYGAPKTASKMMFSLFKSGSLHNMEEYVVRLHRLFGNLTFEEAFRKTGRVLCISISAADTTEPPRLCSHLTTPNVLIWSAIACSSAFPFLFSPQQLMCKNSRGLIEPYHLTGLVSKEKGADFSTVRRWCDGSLEEDLPFRGLSEMFNVSNFLVSQCNPYLVPILAVKRLVPSKIWMLFESEFKHRMGQLLNFWPRNKLLKLVCQPWLGDLNFILPSSAFPTLRSAVNFSPNEIRKAMKEGQRAVWRMLGLVEASCAVEACILHHLKSLVKEERMQLDAVYSDVGNGKKKDKGKVVARQRSSIPSWLDLKSMAMTESLSSESIHPATEKELGDLKDMTDLFMSMDVIAP